MAQRSTGSTGCDPGVNSIYSIHLLYQILHIDFDLVFMYLFIDSLQEHYRPEVILLSHTPAANRVELEPRYRIKMSIPKAQRAN